VREEQSKISFHEFLEKAGNGRTPARAHGTQRKQLRALEARQTEETQNNNET
jgi:hypothetical protein